MKGAAAGGVVVRVCTGGCGSI